MPTPLASNPTPNTPVIVGPTAGGKSDLAIALAQALIAQGKPVVILAADAYQIYRGMDIGTAKPTLAERAGIEHLLLDLVDPHDPHAKFTASDWLSQAEAAIASCHARGVTPIVVGGTHLYVKLLIEGMFDGPPADETLRAQLRAMGLPALRAELETCDPHAAARIHPNDERRTIRAIEVFRLTGVAISEHQRQWRQAQGGGGLAVHAGSESSGIPPGGDRRATQNFALIVLEWEVEAINRRINARVKAMMERGLLDEVRGLVAKGPLATQPREALGYKQLLEHLEGRGTLDAAIEQIKIQTRRFAKNQRTWLRQLRLTPGTIGLAGSDSCAENANKILTNLNLA